MAEMGSLDHVCSRHLFDKSYLDDDGESRRRRRPVHAVEIFLYEKFDGTQVLLNVRAGYRYTSTDSYD
jgi:hypothetical protein